MYDKSLYERQRQPDEKIPPHSGDVMAVVVLIIFALMMILSILFQ